jgi:hypothetical protein
VFTLAYTHCRESWWSPWGSCDTKVTIIHGPWTSERPPPVFILQVCLFLLSHSCFVFVVLCFALSFVTLFLEVFLWLKEEALTLFGLFLIARMEISWFLWERVGSSPRTYDPQEEESRVLQRLSRTTDKTLLSTDPKRGPNGKPWSKKLITDTLTSWPVFMDFLSYCRFSFSSCLPDIFMLCFIFFYKAPW